MSLGASELPMPQLTQLPYVCCHETYYLLPYKMLLAVWIYQEMSLSLFPCCEKPCYVWRFIRYRTFISCHSNKQSEVTEVIWFSLLLGHREHWLILTSTKWYYGYWWALHIDGAVHMFTIQCIKNLGVGTGEVWVCRKKRMGCTFSSARCLKTMAQYS